MKRALFALISLCLTLYCIAQIKEAEQYYGKAKYHLINGDFNNAFKNFKAAADMGYEPAMFEVAICYKNGEGTDVNLNLSFNYTYKAATSSHPYPSAITELGWCYYTGLGTDINYSEAIKWWKFGAEKYADSDHPNHGIGCMRYLGMAYYEGHGIEQDFAQSFYWYRKAALRGDPMAAQRVGLMYLYGSGVDENEVEAVKWIRCAAENDAIGECRVSYFFLGMCYLEGKGNLPKDKDKAILWLKKAANKGYVEANIVLMKLGEK